jgi:sulfite exporter TauE/SafE
MEFNFIMVLALGFLLGMKHAIEPDHIIAVSTIASRSKSLWRSGLTGIFWGIGHTVTLCVVGILLILVKIQISIEWSLSLEFLVGIMLVYLGLTSILPLVKKKIHTHEHQHDEISHTHFHDVHEHTHSNTTLMKSAFIGMIHGLAGSGAMILLTMSTVSNIWQGMLYIVTFGFGTVAGMLFFTTLIGLPFVLTLRKAKLNSVLITSIGLSSTLFGFYYMYDLGVNEGLFQLWLS